MKNFVNRPIPRLARYELLLKSILDATKEGHEDHDSIPQVIEVIKSLLKETQPGVASAEQKVELWRYNSNLVFKPGEAVVSLNFSQTDARPHFTLVGYGLVGREPLAHSYRQAPTATRYWV
jgi:hypothetical protein